MTAPDPREITTPADLLAALEALIVLPRRHQPAAALALRDRIPERSGEAWNAAFDAGSRFHAFSLSTVARGVYTANRAALTSTLSRPGFRIVEVGGGNGMLWADLPPNSVGTIVVVDPHPEAAHGVRRRVPGGVEVRHIEATVQTADLPAADAVIFSLVLHHVAGWNADERRGHGLAGAGKLEVLTRAREAVSERDGLVLLNEADIYCDLGLPPGDPLLAERLVDSYVRRFAMSLAHDAKAGVAGEPGEGGDDVRDLPARWMSIVRDWSLGQVELANVPVSERDVYELDVASWLRLLADAGLAVEGRQFTDPWMLFHQYRCRVASPPAPASTGGDPPSPGAPGR